MRQHALIVSVLAPAAALWLPSASAGTFAISPLRIDLSGQTTTAAVTVRNEDATPVIVQAAGLAWSQEANKDQLEPTRDLLVSPLVFTLPPNGSQVVRVALRVPQDPNHEFSYRITLQEVPPQAAPDFTGLTVALKLSMPVFVAAATPTPADLAWSVARNPDGHLVVSARNDGGTHARITSFTLTALTGPAQAMQQSVATYVLPGSTRSWTIDTNKKTPDGSTANADRYRLKATTERGEVDAELTVGR